MPDSRTFLDGNFCGKDAPCEAARGNNAPKLLEKGGLDYDLSVIPAGYVIRLPKSARYAQILKKLRGLQGYFK